MIDREFYLRVIEHDEWIASTELENRLFYIATSALGDFRAGVIAAGERNTLDAIVIDDLIRELGRR